MQIGKISSENNSSIFSLDRSIFHEVSFEIFGVFFSVPSRFIAVENSNASLSVKGENEVIAAVTASFTLFESRPLMKFFISSFA